MRLMLRLAATLAVLAHPGGGTAAERCNDSHEVVTTALRHNMIGKAKLNGEVVTDVLLKGLCSSGFVTRNGVTWIDWTTVYNGYSYKLGDTMLLKIPKSGRFDDVTYEGDPDLAIRIRMSIELLASDCYNRAKFC